MTINVHYRDHGVIRHHFLVSVTPKLFEPCGESGALFSDWRINVFHHIKCPSLRPWRR